MTDQPDSLVFGAAYYSTPDLRNCPDHMVGALRLLAMHWNSNMLSFQGMYAGSDRWSRRTKMNTRALDQLRTDVMGGVYSNVVAYAGDKHAERAVLSFDSEADLLKEGIPWSVRLVARAGDVGATLDVETLSIKLWEALSPRYGLSVYGEDWKDVNAELTTIPYTMWGVTTDRVNEERLLRLQSLRASFGEHARDAGWGNFLGKHLVERLGGLQHIRDSAPVSFLSVLPDQGVYLRISDSPALLHREGYQSLTNPLTRFFEPVLPVGLVE